MHARLSLKICATVDCVIMHDTVAHKMSLCMGRIWTEFVRGDLCIGRPSPCVMHAKMGRFHSFAIGGMCIIEGKCNRPEYQISLHPHELRGIIVRAGFGLYMAFTSLKL